MTLVVALRADAQEDPCLRRTIAVSVLDKSGEPIHGLTAEDFRAEFRGKPARILSATTDTRPNRVVVLLDPTRAIEDAELWKLAKEAAKAGLQAASDDNKSGLVVFGDRVLVTVGFSDGRLAALKKLDELSAIEWNSESKTALWTALLYGSRLLHPSQFGDTLLVITSGADTTITDLLEARQALLDARARLFAYPVMRIHSPASRPIYKQFEDLRALSELVAATGGGGLRTTRRGSTTGRIAEATRLEADSLSRLIRQVSQFYRMEISIPQHKDAQANWKLELVKKAGLNPQELQLRYPKNIGGCFP